MSADSRGKICGNTPQAGQTTRPQRGQLGPFPYCAPHVRKGPSWPLSLLRAPCTKGAKLAPFSPPDPLRTRSWPSPNRSPPRWPPVMEILFPGMPAPAHNVGNLCRHDRLSKGGETLNEFWVGADPGGIGNFGLAFLDRDGGLECFSVSSVDEAFEKIACKGEPRGLGIDAPMWWSSRSGGGRKADQWLRDTYKIPSGTVASANSLRGAALVGGMMLAFRLREMCPSVRITESHPKALLSALKIDWPRFAQQFNISQTWKNEHERDAAIGAVCAREGFEGCWKTDLALDRCDSEQNPLSYWLSPMHYFWPEKLAPLHQSSANSPAV